MLFLEAALQQAGSPQRRRHGGAEPPKEGEDSMPQASDSGDATAQPEASKEEGAEGAEGGKTGEEAPIKDIECRRYEKILGMAIEARRVGASLVGPTLQGVRPRRVHGVRVPRASAARERRPSGSHSTAPSSAGRRVVAAWRSGGGADDGGRVGERAVEGWRAGLRTRFARRLRATPTPSAREPLERRSPCPRRPVAVRSRRGRRRRIRADWQSGRSWRFWEEGCALSGAASHRLRAGYPRPRATKQLPLCGRSFGRIDRHGASMTPGQSSRLGAWFPQALTLRHHGGTANDARAERPSRAERTK